MLWKEKKISWKHIIIIIIMQWVYSDYLHMILIEMNNVIMILGCKKVGYFEMSANPSRT